MVDGLWATMLIGSFVTKYISCSGRIGDCTKNRQFTEKSIFIESADCVTSTVL